MLNSFCFESFADRIMAIEKAKSLGSSVKGQVSNQLLNATKSQNKQDYCDQFSDILFGCVVEWIGLDDLILHVLLQIVSSKWPTWDR